MSARRPPRTPDPDLLFAEDIAALWSIGIKAARSGLARGASGSVAVIGKRYVTTRRLVAEHIERIARGPTRIPRADRVRRKA